MPKIVPKSVQTCSEVVLGWFFRENFLPSVPWRVESSKSFKKIKKVSKFQKCTKSSPKVSKRVLNMFWGDFFEKFFCPVFHGGSSYRKLSKKSKKFQISKNAQNRPQKCPNEIFQNQKKFQNSKKAQNRSQKCPNVFWTCFEVIFWKKKFAQCSMEGRVFEKFQKNQKSFKVPKIPKIVRRSVQTKIFKKIKKLSNFQKCPKSSAEVSKRNFSKTKKIQKSKHAQNRSQKCPNVFWRCYRVTFSKFFLPSVPWRVESPKIFEKIKKISKFQKCPKSFPKVSKRVLKMF